MAEDEVRSDPLAIPQREVGVPAAPASPDSSSPSTPEFRRDVLRGTSILASVVLACAIAYLAMAVPGTWFPRASPTGWGVKSLSLVRGAGRVVGDELVVTAPDANGISLVTVTADLRSSDYPGIAWIAAGLPNDAEVRLLWRSDVRPDKLNSAPIEVEAGRTLPLVIANNPAWIGHVTGLALAIHGPLRAPVLIRGVVAKPMGAVEILGDRVREWLAFEPWNGASINTITGGAENQDVPLPLALAVVVGIGSAVLFAIRRWRPGAFTAATPVILVGFFLAGWLVLDARWTWNLLRQERATAAQYAAKASRDKHLASEDAPLYAFIQKALAIMPPTPVRIFVAADADYFRGRAAYHLYPHSVYFNPRSNELPAATAFHAGDWILVFQRHGMQFDKALGRVRWDDNQSVSAELKLVEPGAALFVVH